MEASWRDAEILFLASIWASTSSKEFCSSERATTVLSSPATLPGKSRKELTTPEELAQQLKLLLKDLGGSAKGCAIAVSDPESLLRIIEQPNTPIDLLRNALRLNGLMVLNQECKDFVLDCAPGL